MAESAAQPARQRLVAPDAGEFPRAAGRQLAGTPQPQAVDRRSAFVFAPGIGRMLVQDHLRLVEQLAQPARLGGFGQLPADAAAGDGRQRQDIEAAEFVCRQAVADTSDRRRRRGKCRDRGTGD
jgi:hypothetical protein